MDRNSCAMDLMYDVSERVTRSYSLMMDRHRPVLEEVSTISGRGLTTGGLPNVMHENVKFGPIC